MTHKDIPRPKPLDNENKKILRVVHPLMRVETTLYKQEKQSLYMEFSAKQIAEYLGGTVEGDENASVKTFAKIEEGVKGAISFLANPHYAHYLYDTQSSIVLVNKDFKPEDRKSVV